jgi:DNA-binding GntR family transcriptional regulator
VLARLTEAYHVLGMTVKASRPHDVIHSEHRRIVEAIEQNKPDEAEHVARQHVADARKAIRDQVAGGQFVPRWVLE